MTFKPAIAEQLFVLNTLVGLASAATAPAAPLYEVDVETLAA